MTLFDMPNYLWITTLIMILLTIFCCLVLNKWFVSAVITFVILGVLAFYSKFSRYKISTIIRIRCILAIMSLLISFLLWYFTRNWRKERKARKLEKQIEKYGYEGAELRRKDKNNIRQLYAQNHRLLSYTAVTIISKEMEYSAIVVLF